MATGSVGRGLFRDRSFLALWAGTLAVRLGNQIGTIALTWLVLEATGSGARIGLTLALYAAGDMAASPFVGVLLDRFPRKFLLNLANVLLLAIFTLLALLSFDHRLPFVTLLALVVVAGALTPLSYLGRMILLPNLVGPEVWPLANTAMQFNMNLVTLLGPALGGILVATIGTADTLLLTAASYGLYALTLLVLPSRAFRSHAAEPDTAFRSDLTVGWRFLRQVPILAVLTGMTLLFSLTYGPLEPALPILVHTVYHGGAQTLGFLWSGFAVGALVGTVLWGRFSPDWSLRPLVSGIIVAWGIFSGLVGLLPGVPLAMASLALGGLTYAPYNILYTTWRQRLVPDPLRGKVFGTINGITGIGLPLGQALGGFLIAAVGARHTVLVGGLACIALGALAYAGRSLWEEGPAPGTAPDFPA